jgi:hypothetical protein
VVTGNQLIFKSHAFGVIDFEPFVRGICRGKHLKPFNVAFGLLLSV